MRQTVRPPIAPPTVGMRYFEFLERYESEGETFLDSIVTGDETWVCHYIPESKR